MLFQAFYALLNIIKEIVLVPGYIENWVIIVDLEGFVDKKELVQNLYDTHLTGFIDIFQLNYPNYLDKLYFINFPHSYLDLLQKFREKLNCSYDTLLHKLAILGKDEIDKLKENIDKSQLEKKYGGTFPNYQDFWPPKSIINPQCLKLIIPKKELYNSEFIYMHESEEDIPQKKKIPKFKDLSYSPLRSEKEHKLNKKNLRNTFKQPAKFKEHNIFEKTLPKQFLFDDWESGASSSSRMSEPKNPLKSRQNKFIEDYHEKPCITENAEIVRGSFKRESTKQLYQTYFNEKYQKKIIECIFWLFCINKLNFLKLIWIQKSRRIRIAFVAFFLLEGRINRKKTR